ncbi:MAG: DUF2378 family protein [Myxococcota bacterium]
MVAPWRQVSEEPLPQLGHTEDSHFEALFLHGLDTPPELRAALATIGVDLERLVKRYPSTLFNASVDLARSYLYATASSREAADRELGRKFAAGFMRTIPGKLLNVALPFLSIRALLSRLPRYARLGRDDLTVETEPGQDGGLRLLVVDPATARPFFFLGALEQALDRLSQPYRTTLVQVDAWRFEVHVTWHE